MKGLKNSVTYSSKATAKDIAMFAFACIILISTIVFLSLPTGFDLTNLEAGNANLPGAEIIAGFISVQAIIIAGILLNVALFICWGIGLTLSAKLAFKKKDIPRWLHISSIVLTVIYSLFIITPITILIKIIF